LFGVFCEFNELGFDNRGHVSSMKLLRNFLVRVETISNESERFVPIVKKMKKSMCLVLGALT
jgi:hypothetical protein